MLLQNLLAEFTEALLSDNQTESVFQPAHNISIYQNNYFSQLTQSLQKTYPLITQLVGEDFFKQTAREYINRYPSCSGNLHEYGEYFSDFLAEYQPVSDLIYLPEVATFEWTCHTLYFASDHAAFDIALLEN